MFPLRHGALFVVFCAEPACFVKNVHLLLCIFAAAPPRRVHGLKSYLIIQDIHGILSRTPSRGAWIEIHCSDTGTVRQSRRLPTRHREKMFQRSAVRMNPADIIKDAVALIKEYAQELSQKEHRNDVESGELIGYTEALSVLQDACSPDMRREIGLDFDIDAAYLNSTKKGGTCCYDLDGKEID